MRIGASHVAVGIAGCIPFAMIAFLILPTLRQSGEAKLRKIEELTTLLKNKGIRVLEDNSCKDNVLGYYVSVSAGQDPSIVFCSNNLNMNDKNATWDTLAHEAAHAMQDCNGGNIADPNTFAFWEEQMQGHARASYRTIHGEYSKSQYKDEIEARMMERLPDWEVIDKFKTYCKAT